MLVRHLFAHTVSSKVAQQFCRRRWAHAPKGNDSVSLKQLFFHYVKKGLGSSNLIASRNVKKFRLLALADHNDTNVGPLAVCNPLYPRVAVKKDDISGPESHVFNESRGVLFSGNRSGYVQSTYHDIAYRKHSKDKHDRCLIHSFW